MLALYRTVLYMIMLMFTAPGRGHMIHFFLNNWKCDSKLVYFAQILVKCTIYTLSPVRAFHLFTTGEKLFCFLPHFSSHLSSTLSTSLNASLFNPTNTWLIGSARLSSSGQTWSAYRLCGGRTCQQPSPLPFYN